MRRRLHRCPQTHQIIEVYVSVCVCARTCMCRYHIGDLGGEALRAVSVPLVEKPVYCRVTQSNSRNQTDMKMKVRLGEVGDELRELLLKILSLVSAVKFTKLEPVLGVLAEGWGYPGRVSSSRDIEPLTLSHQVWVHTDTEGTSRFHSERDVRDIKCDEQQLKSV